MLKTADALAERDAMLSAWAVSNDLLEIAQCAVNQHWGMHQGETLEAAIHFGQISGSIDSRETLLQQHLTTDLSLFVVNEVVPSKASLDRRQVVAWALKLSCDEISKALQSDQCHSYTKKFLQERLAVQRTALAIPILRDAISGQRGRSMPGKAAIINARRSKSGLNPKASDALRAYEGLRRLAPFALRRIILETVLDCLASQSLLELAAGLAISEALSIASGYPLKWNSTIASDGVMAKVGPFAVGWHKPININADQGQTTVAISDSRTGLRISFIRCDVASEVDLENEVIRLATESLVASCRSEAKKGPLFEETPLENCAVVMRRPLAFRPESPAPDRLIITEFEEIVRGRLLGLAHLICDRALPT